LLFYFCYSFRSSCLKWNMYGVKDGWQIYFIWNKQTRKWGEREKKLDCHQKGQYGIIIISMFLSCFYINKFHISDFFFFILCVFNLIKQSNGMEKWSVNVWSTFFTIQHYCNTHCTPLSFYSFVHNYHITHIEWNLMVAVDRPVRRIYLRMRSVLFFDRLRCN